MKRLTVEHWQNLDPWECCGQDNYCVRPNNKPGGCRNGCIVQKLYTRLAQYEDTGLSPEEVKTERWIPRSEKLPDAFVSVLVEMPGEEPFPIVREGYISDDGTWVAGNFKREREKLRAGCQCLRHRREAMESDRLFQLQLPFPG